MLDKGCGVTPKRLTNFRLEDELLEGLSLVKDRDGIPLTEQVRRAVRLCFGIEGSRHQDGKGGAP